MVRLIGRNARYTEDCTGIPDVAHVFGPGVANTISASDLASRKQAGHLIASDQVRTLLQS